MATLIVVLVLLLIQVAMFGVLNDLLKEYRLTKKSEIAEIQILNLTNKSAQHNTAIQRLQDSCIEVK